MDSTLDKTIITADTRIVIRFETDKSNSRKRQYVWCSGVITNILKKTSHCYVVDVKYDDGDILPPYELLKNEENINWKLELQSSTKAKKMDVDRHCDYDMDTSTNDMDSKIQYYFDKKFKTDFIDTIRHEMKKDFSNYIDECIKHKLSLRFIEQDKKIDDNSVMSSLNKNAKKRNCVMNNLNLCKTSRDKISFGQYIPLHVFAESRYKENSIFTNEHWKTFMSDLVGKNGLCHACSVYNNQHSTCVYIDFTKRYTQCVVCKRNGANTYLNLPICGTCNKKINVNNKESFFDTLFDPLLKSFINRFPTMKIDCDSRLSFKNITRPDAVIHFTFTNQNEDNIIRQYQCIVVIEKDENQHCGEESNDNEKIKRIVFDDSYNYIFVIRLNTNGYTFQNKSTNDPPSLDRLIVLRCWVIWYMLQVKELSLPRYIQIYLYYSDNIDKRKKLMFKGDPENYYGLGFAYGAPEHPEHKNYVYALEPTEGQDFTNNKKYECSWGKHLTSCREPFNKVFPKYDNFKMIKNMSIIDYINYFKQF